MSLQVQYACRPRRGGQGRTCEYTMPPCTPFHHLVAIGYLAGAVGSPAWQEAATQLPLELLELPSTLLELWALHVGLPCHLHHISVAGKFNEG